MQVSNEMLIEGFRRSYARTRAAKNTRDGIEVFYALLETLNWIFCIDDKLRRGNSNWFHKFGEEGNFVIALRYARNRVQHQWADITTMTEGFAIPAELPMAFHEWIWKPLDEIPLPTSRFRDDMGQQFYIELLQGKPVRYSLQKFNSFI